MKKNYIKTLCFCMCFLVTNQAFGYQDCIGKVTSFAVNDAGEVRIKTSYRGNWATICKLDGSWQNIGADVCKVWISESQIAHSTQKDIRVSYVDGTDCSNFPINSSSPKPYWVILQP